MNSKNRAAEGEIARAGRRCPAHRGPGVSVLVKFHKEKSLQKNEKTGIFFEKGLAIRRKVWYNRWVYG